jgi:N-acylglucosamine 2-epimerase
MFFQVTRAGDPLRKRRYLFTEGFGVLAFAAYGKAACDQEYIRKAYDLYSFMEKYPENPDRMLPKVNPSVRPTKGIGLLMQQMNILQVLRSCGDDGKCTQRIDALTAEIASDFIHEDTGWILEVVGLRGEFIDHFGGRQIAPGHIIEVAWFILHEARVRGNDRQLISMGCRILDWAWEMGWDKEFGGIIYYRDVKGSPCAEYWHDMKFWWPQNETIIACLLAYFLTGEEKYHTRHTMIHEWTYQRFPDPEYGEWLGYLHRDGRVSSTLKGTLWKGPFHIPRMQLYCWKLLEEMKSLRQE